MLSRAIAVPAPESMFGSAGARGKGNSAPIAGAHMRVRDQRETTRWTHDAVGRFLISVLCFPFLIFDDSPVRTADPTMHAMPEHAPVTLHLAHSPDPDDAFMWWPLFELKGEPPRLDTGRFRFESLMQDIETLNQRSEQGDLEITAMSCAQYPRVRERYAITACGSSMGDAYGPKIIARRPMTLDELRARVGDLTIAIPGERTSAFGVLNLMMTDGATIRHEVVDFKSIIDRVAAGDFEVGLIIHEGQLTFESAGVHEVADVGQWWDEQHGLPLPLGINTVRRDLDDVHGPGTMHEVAALLSQSLDYALDHRAESVAYALEFARDMSSELADEFIGLYVNSWTLDFGPRGRQAVEVFLGELHAAGLTPAAGSIDFVGEGHEERA